MQRNKAFTILPRLTISRILTILVMAFLSACSTNAGTEISLEDSTPTLLPTEIVPQAGRGAPLRIFLWQSPDILNPHLASGVKDRLASRMVYEPLATMNPDYELIPLLAVEIPTVENGDLAEDLMSVTWRLRQDVKWSDGEDFNADDVLFTYDYITNPDVGSTSATTYEFVDTVEKIDDFTIQITFTEPQQNWWTIFGADRGMILPEHIFAEYNNESAPDAPVNLAPVGTGPYQLKEFNNEDILIIAGDAVNTTEIVFEPNPYYREDGKPYFSEVILQGGGGDANYAAQVLLADMADFSWAVYAENDLLDQLEEDPTVTLDSVSDGSYEILHINFTDPNRVADSGERSSLQYPHPFLTDLRVRQAIRFAIDWDAIDEAFGYSGELTPNIIFTPEEYNSPNTELVYDAERAAVLLDEAGWVDSDGDGVRDKDGETLSIVYQTSVNALRQRVQNVIKENLEVVGFEVELQAIDSSIFFSSDPNNPNTSGRFYADFQVWGGGYSELDILEGIDYWRCNQIPQMENNWSGYNSGRFCSEEFEALIDYARNVEGTDEFPEAVIAANDYLIDNIVVIPLARRTTLTAFDSNLIGFEYNPIEFEVWNIADWYWSEE